MTKTGLVFLFALIVAWPASPSRAEDDGRRVPLLDDARFEQGFTVWSPAPGKHAAKGVIAPRTSDAAPRWGLAQWHSRFTLAEAKPESLPDGAIRCADAAKAVTFFPASAAADISLALNANIEYQSKAPARGDPWPHLLAERELASHPAVTELQAVPLNIRYRLTKAEIFRPQGFDQRRHTAQFVFYITVQNRNRQSAGFGDYYWFGVPLYDARYRLPRAHRAVDKGSDRKPATGKFIFNPGGEQYTTQSAHDGEWVTITKDLLPLMKEGLQNAWQRGYLPDSHDAADYRLMAMNFGWEVTGPINVEMQVADLQLDALLARPDK